MVQQYNHSKMLMAHKSYGAQNESVDIFMQYSVNACLQCFDAVGWAAGRASDL